MSLSQNISADDASDQLTAYGVKISGEFLRAIVEPTADGVWFRIVRWKDGTVGIEMHREPPKSEQH